MLSEQERHRLLDIWLRRDEPPEYVKTTAAFLCDTLLKYYHEEGRIGENTLHVLVLISHNSSPYVEDEINRMLRGTNFAEAFLRRCTQKSFDRDLTRVEIYEGLK